MTRPNENLPSASLAMDHPPRNRARLVGHLLLNTQRNVFAADPEATAMLQDVTGEATLSADRLLIRDPTWAAEIDARLTSAPDGGPQTSTSPRGYLRFELRPLTRVSFAGSGSLTLVTVHRLHAGVADSDGATTGIARTFGLSAAETRVLDALCSGFRLRDYAARRPVSIHTARTQLKSLMAKLHVHSQVEAVRVALQHTLFDRDVA